MSKEFVNGFESWHETHYQVSAAINYQSSINDHGKAVEDVLRQKGLGGLYELAEELTDKFELLHKDREWDGDFFDEIESFLEEELK